MPRVSVILTCYNHLQFLPEAVESITSQTYKDFEIVAIDDGSTDGTRDWLKEHSGSLRVMLNESNLGTYGSLNRAIAAAGGEYIAILNDDDYWASTKLQKQVDLLDSSPNMGLCHVGGQFVDEKGETLHGAPLGFEYPATSSGRILHELIYHNKIIPSSAMIRRSALDTTGPFDPSFFGCGDWQLFLRIAEHFEIGHINEPLLFYRVHPGNASLNTAKMDEDDDRIRSWIESRTPELLKRLAGDKAIYTALAHNFACLGTIRSMKGDTSAGRRAYAHSIRMLPFRFKSYLRWLATFLPQKTFRAMR